MEHAAEASGSRFAYLLGDLVLVELALSAAPSSRSRDEGFTPVVAAGPGPRGGAYGTGFFPGEREMIYEIPRDELFLVGTSEVSLAALHADEILERRRAAAPLRRHLDLLPARGRRGRQGHARDLPRAPVRQGRDVLVRRAGRLGAEHERLLAIQERILAALEIPYRVVDIPVGDLGAPPRASSTARPGSRARSATARSPRPRTRPTTRRGGSNARYRPGGGGSPETLHTLNGTAVAVGRTLIALIENRQDADGRFDLPSALVDAGAPASIPVS